MEGIVSQKEIAAATAYENLHVPALFQQWAPRVTEAAQIQPGFRVLDVACGTGVLTRDAALRAGKNGHAAGLDVSPGMLVVAKRLAPEVEWREGMAESLPFEAASFDAVISQFGLMFFQDRELALREMMRVLVPGGRMAIAVWDALKHSAAYPIEVALLERVVGEPAADALRAPFLLGDQVALTELFRGAGVASIEVTKHIGTACFPSIRTMVEADLRGWLPVMGVVLTEEQIARVLNEAEQVLGQFVTPRGTVEFDSPALIVTGRKH